MKLCNFIKKCPITDDEHHQMYLNLGHMPLVNNLNNTREESIFCERYILAVQHFKNSGLTSLVETINPDVLYKNYLYKSGVSKPYIDHCSEMYNFIEPYVNFKSEDYVLDIGGNDGTLLKTFLSKNSNLNVLNVDASENLTKEANKNGINSVCAFWGTDFYNDYKRQQRTRFKAITTTNCFQHTPPIDDFVKAIKNALHKWGVWCLEFPYWKTSLETFQFDQIYHEHVYYYTLKSLVKLFDKHDLRIIKIVPREIHGGTLRLLVSHKGELGEAFQPCHGVNEAIVKEYLEEIDLEKWGKEVEEKIKEYSGILKFLSKDYKIAGFGAAAKGCVFLNATKLTYGNIEYVIDDTDIKQGKFIPGTGIEIVSREKLKTHPVDYILILAHNFKDYIIESLRKDGYTGKFIVCLPKFEII